MSGNRKFIDFIEACFRLYEQKMYGVAWHILQDESMAEDAVQDAFLRLIKREITFEDPESEECKRYILTVIRNTSIDMYRERQKNQEMLFLTDSIEDLEAETEDSAMVPRPDITAYIRQLPKKYRNVVICIAEEELSVRETAVRLGISEATVRKQYERAKKRLKAMLVKKQCGKSINDKEEQYERHRTELI